MPKRTPSLETRLDSIEATLEDLRAELRELGASTDELASMRDDVDQLRAELAMRRRKNPGLSPEAKNVRAQNAAIARASKEVGKPDRRGHVGIDKLRTPAMKKKLQAQAQAGQGTKKKKR